MEFLYAICIIAVIIGLIVLVAGLIDGEVYAAVGLIIAVLGFIFAYGINTHDASRAVERNAIHERYGIVTDLSSKTIKIDNEDTYHVYSVVTSKFDTKLDVKIGDLVKVTYLDGDVRNYAAVVVGITATENGGS